jgi:hypothetical protein
MHQAPDFTHTRRIAIEKRAPAMLLHPHLAFNSGESPCNSIGSDHDTARQRVRGGESNAEATNFTFSRLARRRNARRCVERAPRVSNNILLHSANRHRAGKIF